MDFNQYLLAENDEIKLEEPFEDIQYEKQLDEYFEEEMPKLEVFDDQGTSEGEQYYYEDVYSNVKLEPPEYQGYSQQPDFEEHKPENLLEKHIKEEPDDGNFPHNMIGESSKGFLSISNDSKPLNVVQKFYIQQRGNRRMPQFPDKIYDTDGTPIEATPYLLIPEPSGIPGTIQKSAPWKIVCPLCHKDTAEKRQVKSQRDKLMILIGCILLEELTMEQVKEFMFFNKNQLVICPHHFTNTTKAIIKVLKIENPSSSDNLLEVLIHKINVNDLYVNLTIEKFIDYFQTFVMENSVRVWTGPILKKWKKAKMEMNEMKPPVLVEPVRVETNQIMRKCEHEMCSVCHQSNSHISLRAVSFSKVKMVIIIGQILLGNTDIEEAKTFLRSYEFKFICPSHFVEAVTSIFDLLDIDDQEQISECLIMPNLMKLINTLCPFTSQSDFRQALNEFISMVTSLDGVCPDDNIEIKEVRHNRIFLKLAGVVENLRTYEIDLANTPRPNKRKAPAKKPKSVKATATVSSRTLQPIMPVQHVVVPSLKHYCDICHNLKFKEELRWVSQDGERLVLMIGQVLRDIYTSEQAQSLIYEKKRVLICNSHIVEAFTAVCNVLRVESLRRCPDVSVQLFKNLFYTAKSICPRLALSQFREILISFAMRNEQYGNMEFGGG